MKNGTPQVAVIILNWNGEKLLAEFLPTVLQHTDPAIGKVIVADNGSTDGSLGLLNSRFPEVEILRIKENLGFAGGYNYALKHYAQEYPYAVLLNSDVAVRDNWLKPLFDFMESHPEAGGCQPKIRSYREPEMFEYAGACGGFIDRNGYPYCRGRIFGCVEKDNGQYDSVLPVFWATGAALMVRTEVYLKAGGLDTSFFAHMEEIDLCWRMQLCGWKLYVVPQSVVWHLGGGSLSSADPRKTFLNFRNNLLMLYKNLPDSTRRSTLLRRRLLDTIAWTKFVITFDFANASAIWRAHRQFASMKKKYTAFPESDLLHVRPRRPNLLVSFYLKGRKTFARLHA